MEAGTLTYVQGFVRSLKTPKALWTSIPQMRLLKLMACNIYATDNTTESETIWQPNWYGPDCPTVVDLFLYTRNVVRSAPNGFLMATYFLRNPGSSI